MELKKIVRSKKFVILILLCLILPAAVLYQNQANSDRYAWDLYNKMGEASLAMHVAKQEYRERMKENGLSVKEMEPHLFFFTALEGEMEALLRLPWGYESRFEIPERMVAFYNAYQAYAEDRTVNYQGRQFFHLFEDKIAPEWVEAEKAYFQGLVDQGLPYEDPVYSVSGFNFTRSVLDTVLGMPLALLLVLLLADIFAAEKENGVEKLRQTQPVKRRNILLAKLAAAFIFVFAALVTLLAVSYLLAGLLGSGFGSFTYPLEIDRGFIDTCGPVWRYVGLATLNYSLYLLVIISALPLFAAFIKDTSLTAALGLLLVFAGDLLGAKTNIYNPFSYCNYQYYIGQGQGKPLLMTGVALGIFALVALFAHYLGATTWVQNFTLTGKRKEGGRALEKYEQKKVLPFPVFKFEALKILKKKSTVIPFSLLVILALLQGLSQRDLYDQNRQNEAAFHTLLAAHFLAYEPPEGVDEEYIDRSEAINRYEIDVRFLEALESDDADSIIRAQKDSFLESAPYSFGPPETVTVYSATLDEMIERGVQPIYSNTVGYMGMLRSPFAGKQDLRNIRGANLRNIQPSVTFIQNSLFKDGLALLALAIFAVSLAFGFSDETQGTRSIYLLNTQPLRRHRLYFGKFLAQSTVFIAMVLILALVLSGGLSLAGSPLEKNFPAVKYLNSLGPDYSGERLWRSSLRVHEGQPLPSSVSDLFVGFTFRDMSDENLEMTALLVLAGLCLLAFALAISQRIPNKIGVSLGSLLFFGLGYAVCRYALRGGFYLPFIWLDSSLVATGEASMIFDQSIITSLMGFLILGLWLAALLFLGYRLYSKTGRYL